MKIYKIAAASFLGGRQFVKIHKLAAASFLGGREFVKFHKLAAERFLKNSRLRVLEISGLLSGL